jgi:hypothetical protein
MHFTSPRVQLLFAMSNSRYATCSQCGFSVCLRALQGQDARDSGVSDVCRLLAAPEDLARLQQLRAEVCCGFIWLC